MEGNGGSALLNNLPKATWQVGGIWIQGVAPEPFLYTKEGEGLDGHLPEERS